MLKILQARLQQYMNQELKLSDVQAGFRKSREPERLRLCWAPAWTLCSSVGEPRAGSHSDLPSHRVTEPLCGAELLEQKWRRGEALLIEEGNGGHVRRAAGQISGERL